MGCLIGLAVLCKVHGIYLSVGFELSIILLKPRWLLKGQLYMPVVITLDCLSPILFWNIQYNFITYQFHAERVTHTSLQWDSLLQELLGEMGYQNTIVFLLIVVALISYFKRKVKFDTNEVSVWLFCMSITMIVLFRGIELFNQTLPHWTGTAYITL